MKGVLPELGTVWGQCHWGHGHPVKLSSRFPNIQEKTLANLGWIFVLQSFLDGQGCYIESS